MSSLWILASAGALYRQEPPLWMILIGLLATAAVGRLILSLLPAGLPGEHRLLGLPLTWATSHTLGALTLGAQGHVMRQALGGPTDFRLILAPWLLLLVVRLASLPAAMVPRHRAQLSPAGLPQKLLLCAGLAAVLFAAPARTMNIASGLAAAIMIAASLREARLPVLVWCLAPGIYAAYLQFSPWGQPALGALLGLSFASAWLRIADRRACVLACIGFASLLPSLPSLAVAALAGLVVLSKPAQRKYALVSSLATSALFSITLL